MLWNSVGVGSDSGAFDTAREVIEAAIAVA
jgi:hypothetical protein